MGLGRKFVAVLAAVALLCSSTMGATGPASEAGKAPEVKYSDFLLVKPGAFGGKVLYTDGKTPAAGVAVRVWSTTQEKFVHNTTTDKKGEYKLPKLEAGQYLVVYGDRVRVDLRVDEKAELSPQPLNVIIPRGKLYAAPEGGVGELGPSVLGLDEEGGGPTLRSVLFIGGGVVTAVGVVAAVAAGLGGGGGSKNVVSP